MYMRVCPSVCPSFCLSEGTDNIFLTLVFFKSSESRHLDEIGFTARPTLSDKLHDPQEAVKIAKKGDTFIQQGLLFLLLLMLV